MKNILELARESGAATVFGDGLLFTPTQLAAFAQRIREDERERFVRLFDACLPDVIGAVLAGAAYSHEDIERYTPRALSVLEVLNSVAAIRRGGDHG